MLEHEAGIPQLWAAPDAARSGPSAAAALAGAPLWELALLRKHYHPHVAQSAAVVAAIPPEGACAQCQQESVCQATPAANMPRFAGCHLICAAAQLGACWLSTPLGMCMVVQVLLPCLDSDIRKAHTPCHSNYCRQPQQRAMWPCSLSTGTLEALIVSCYGEQQQ